jgi:hypothetical protein
MARCGGASCLPRRRPSPCAPTPSSRFPLHDSDLLEVFRIAVRARLTAYHAAYLWLAQSLFHQSGKAGPEAGQSVGEAQVLGLVRQ